MINSDFDDYSKLFNGVVAEIEKESEEFWNSLTKDQQLKVFCAVSRRIFKGEIQEQGTFRYVLYDTFGFGPEAYVPAQMSGYLSIHNALFDSEEAKHESKNRSV
jgi:hypothetical protein